MKIFSLTFMIGVILTNMIYAQSKDFYNKNFEEWSSIITPKISEDNQYISFRNKYPSVDTLVVMDLNGKLKLKLPKVKEDVFWNNKSVTLSNSTLQISDLSNGQNIRIDNVKKFNNIQERNVLIVHNIDNSLKFFDDNGNILKSIDKIEDYWYIKDQQLIYCYSISNNFTDLYEINLKESLNHNLRWQGPDFNVSLLKSTNDGAFFYLKNKIQNQLVYMNHRDKKVYKSNSDILKNEIVNNPSDIETLHHNKGIFFTLKKVLHQYNVNSNPEIWYGNEKEMFPLKKMKENNGFVYQRWSWDYEKDIFQQITNDTLPHFQHLENKNYILLFNKLSNIDDSRLVNEIDIYIKNLRTNKIIPLIKGYDLNASPIKSIRNTNDLIFYYDDNWVIHNYLTNETKQITKNINTKWDNAEGDAGYQKITYGITGYLPDIKSLLINDKNDIWLVPLDDNYPKRLTTGMDQNKVYRMINSKKNLRNVYHVNPIENQFPFLIEILNQKDYSKSYALMDKDFNLNLIHEESNNNIPWLTYKEGNLIYIEENYNLPPRLVVKRNEEDKYSIIYKTNQHFEKNKWGTSLLLEYNSQLNTKNKAALFLPPNYDPNKKYPMVVRVYQHLAPQFNNFIPPSWANSVGFNVTNFTLNDYVVLMPNINYIPTNPMVSIVDNVLAAVNETINRGIVDKNKIGIFGQSFGGYETNLIITQTDIFAAAISGASIFDIVNGYFTLNDKMESWRYENHQFRLKLPYYKAKEIYHYNNPIYHADKINTPLLTYTGLADNTVSPNQTFAIYTALRKLKKKHIMLRYPSEGHSFTNFNNQKDLTIKVMQWFETFLKNEQNYEWIKFE
ncbi:alpha/beta hydrolase family protein [Faecalibacter sp. LW9]|uniref:alpha/beta hydrolase family protein n=1 Tax=Faecalibacter sp. LW9 TaxID=3103144 RepID=UPI002AFE0640|nr:prolyl oligopeptidase family serine peptidase [Faecalibacter sp. LW9]